MLTKHYHTEIFIAVGEISYVQSN